MIFIDRNRLDSAGNPIRPSGAWFLQANASTANALTNRTSSDFKFSDDVYGHDSVRGALFELFFEKCAYCEYNLARTDLNVEHYRPKGRVAELRNRHLGYYWLAYDWVNLLPSCTFCNQSRKDPPTWHTPASGPAMGKSDQFPIEDEAHRAWIPVDDLSAESPYLINPCIDDPSQHITFDIYGKPLAIGPRGAKTIEICHLDQSMINKDRKRRIDLMIGLIDMLVDSPTSVPIKKLIDAQTSDENAYAGVARAVKARPQDFGAGI